ncbi:UDP-N-acetylmuramate dehydrogenase [Roseivirga pacifica]|uniref:UDP-N-acetylmuramate dehydrogenase n=1 Tax=Roseivirga pacifica TaxID=1267423 RepID=UPI002095AA4D|nr:UDP-N-acetylmuramate dehydrogenase [Roseivirga pacifica]MCO6360694.1 UDP-N-acetylmuramate dehydrogenase [Roseivirga pacifica]MCO6368583.1 UDP-N-acetylmuramate dehydrogenase [Roseivirga pacifica]MCO6372725.1 UDP-N-acetylmuramate dehydrogenase [Roseivirga pacifica]MCO6376783.1 UDP-N-acetylmuramate dehydrogenase [Roseivirga pacifica]MCO6377937.1 UDP-N-acetylmuramate dehydrogenase [Roseivirga pacifica]
MSEFLTDYSLQPYNTFGLDVKAKSFARFKSLETLKEGLQLAKNQPLLILGGGSNLLFTKDYDGLVLKNELKGIDVIKEDAEHFYVEAQAGENWHQFVMHCIANNWAGVENLSLIPGTVGAAPMQNIGAYGVEIIQVFDHLKAMEIATGEIHTFNKEDCQFGYRESVFKKSLKGKYVITSVCFKLKKTPDFNTSYGAIAQTLEDMGVTELSIKAVSDAVIHIRQTKLPDPKEIGNSGSFFKNPEVDKIDFEGLRAEFPSIPGYPLPDNKVKIPAAWLIDQDGWKGKTFGQIGVHKNQPLVLVNYGGGKGADIKALAFKIQASVATKFGIVLTPEVNIV